MVEIDRTTAEKLYSVSGVDIDEAKRLRREAKRDGWNATLDYDCHTGRYDVKVFGPRDDAPEVAS